MDSGQALEIIHQLKSKFLILDENYVDHSFSTKQDLFFVFFDISFYRVCLFLVLGYKFALKKFIFVLDKRKKRYECDELVVVSDDKPNLFSRGLFVFSEEILLLKSNRERSELVNKIPIWLNDEIKRLKSNTEASILEIRNMQHDNEAMIISGTSIICTKHTLNRS